MSAQLRLVNYLHGKLKNDMRMLFIEDVLDEEEEYIKDNYDTCDDFLPIRNISGDNDIDFISGDDIDFQRFRNM